MHHALLAYLDDLQRAGKAGAWYSAFALALTLPDICSAVGVGRGRSRDRYIEWVRLYVEPKFTSASGPQLDARAIYALRCEVLHTATADISAQSAAEGSILDRIVITECTRGTGFSIWKFKGPTVTSRGRLAVPVDQVCDGIAAGVRAWYPSIEHDEQCQAHLDTLYVFQPFTSGPDG